MYVARSLGLLFAALSSIALVGCGTRGAPDLVRTDSGVGAEFIPGCKNVAPNYRVETFMVGSYLTTWDSALVEGAQEGVRQAVEAPNAKGTAGAAFVDQLTKLQPGRAEATNRLLQSPAAKWGIRTNTLGKIPEPFCRRFDRNQDVVSLAARDVLSSIRGYRLITNDIKWGMFETDFVEQRSGKLRWRDRFVIYVDPDGPGSSVVRIFRDIYIDRSGAMFNQGISVGRNEAYVFTKIEDTLARRP